MSEVSLFSLDVLPAKCGIEAQISGTAVRFRANRVRVGWLTRRTKPIQVSRWSGWFSINDTPIALIWETFEWDK